MVFPFLYRSRYTEIVPALMAVHGLCLHGGHATAHRVFRFPPLRSLYIVRHNRRTASSCQRLPIAWMSSGHRDIFTFARDAKRSQEMTWSAIAMRKRRAG